MGQKLSDKGSEDLDRVLPGSRRQGTACSSCIADRSARLVRRIPRLLLLPLVAVAILIPVLALVLPVSLSIHNSNTRNSYGSSPFMCGGPVAAAAAAAAEVSPPGACGRFPGPALLMWTQVLSLQVAASSMTLGVELKTAGSLAGKYAPAGGGSIVKLPAGHKLVFQVGNTQKEYVDGSPLTRFMADVQLASECTPPEYDYPFDTHQANVTIIALITGTGPGNTCFNNSNSSSSFPGGGLAAHQQLRSVVPVSLEWYLDTSISGFTLHPAANAEAVKAQSSLPVPMLTETLNGSITALRAPFVVERDRLTQFMSMFTTVLMWLLSAFMAGMAVDMTLCRPRAAMDLELTVATCIGLLFALPNVRNLQPGIPAIGCLVDVAGFTGSMCLLAVTVLLLLAAYVGVHEP